MKNEDKKGQIMVRMLLYILSDSKRHAKNDTEAF